MNIMLLTFGTRVENHYQAIFAIISFIAEVEKNNIKTIVVVTDQPIYYKCLADKITILEVSQEQLTKWQAPHDFFWRIKIKAIEYVQQQYPHEHLLYIDSDIFLATNLYYIKSELDRGNSFMHQPEAILAQGESKTERRMWQVLQNQTFCGIKIDTNSTMWNAGVIGLPSNRAEEIISLTLNVCDAICETKCTRRLVEQYAFSISLAQLTQLKSCPSEIGHYWGNKTEWNEFIERFLLTGYLQQKSILELSNLITKTDLTKLALVKKPSSTGQKLKRLIDKIWQPKKVVYFK